MRTDFEGPRSRRGPPLPFRQGGMGRQACWLLPVVLGGMLLVGGGPARAQDGGLSVARHFAVRQVDVGTTVRTLRFRDTTGLITIDPHHAPATVVMFVDGGCGTTNAYQQRIRALYETYRQKHVQFFLLQSYGGMAAGGRTWDATQAPLIHTLVYGDGGSQLANRLGPEHTPEAFVFDSSGTLRYRGAIDDGGGQGEGQDGSNLKHPGPYLQWALDAVLAGKPVPIPRTKAFGCMVHAAHPSGSNGQ